MISCSKEGYRCQSASENASCLVIILILIFFFLRTHGRKISMQIRSCQIWTVQLINNSLVHIQWTKPLLQSDPQNHYSMIECLHLAQYGEGEVRLSITTLMSETSLFILSKSCITALYVCHQQPGLWLEMETKALWQERCSTHIENRRTAFVHFNV